MSDLPRYAPATVADVQQIVAHAMSSREGLEISGGGSKRAMRGPILPSAQLDLSKLTGITDYDADELVLTAYAGTPLAEVEAALAARRQMLAFEPFDHGPLFGAAVGRATLGGIVAANVSGPRRLASGAARDHILGFTAVSGRGETLKGGGAVVKNVTGFDLPKLMAGSWGTLAVFITLTLRVLPQPRAEATLLFRGLSSRAANRLMGAAMATPAAVSSAAHVHAPDPVTALRLEGFGPSVEARVRELQRVLEPLAADATEIRDEESSAFWRSVRTLDMLPRDAHALWRVSVPPARGADVESLLGVAELRFAFDWAGALVWIAVPEHGPLASGERIRAVARSLGGHAQRVRGPQPVRATSEGANSAAASAPGVSAFKLLNERLKATFDPSGILNPGLDLAADY